MEEEGEVGGLMKKMMADKNKGGNGEVDYKNKSGTAWSHSYLNQKPWHPLSYPNQRRKWIAEQTNAQRQRRSEEVAREFAQEQEFFRQTALISKKEKEKVETMKAVSFMYVRPPGYNAESAKAAELEDERKRLGLNNPPSNSASDSPAMPSESSSMAGKDLPTEEKKKKPRPKDVFGRALPTEEEFQVLKNAPRLETGLPARVKPFGVEIRNVKCARCGTYGHQSGDRECPLRDAIMPNEENRLKRDDPLNAILAQIDSSEPLKWELKQKPGISPPRGGFKPDDPNQQIVAEDIFDEYGGFLSGGNIPDLLTNFSVSKSRKHSKSKSKHKSQSLTTDTESKARHKNRSLSPSDSNAYREKRSREKKMKEKKHKKKKRRNSGSSSSDNSDSNRHHKRNKRQLSDSSSSDDSASDRHHKRSKHRHHHHHHHHHHHRRRHGDSTSTSD
ncbi:CBF1-interacting co-repressor CIR [Macleaya cordata]|uniref:CBF1-interacting co-repressor CIR n=1 Tax=Macleaya cordata TaxID=56857 RepID=A0A200QNJ8_MACCD|nr:CBF1-interacting co-repressor CIR [Macleaya cordata]